MSIKIHLSYHTLQIRGSALREIQQAIANSPLCDLCGQRPMACTVTNQQTGQSQKWCADCADRYCQQHGFRYEDLI